MAVSKQRYRHRSSSDPFSDPTTISHYSSYGVPTLSRNAPQHQHPPPPPPKAPHKPYPTSGRSHPQPHMTTGTGITEALRDTVTVKAVDSNPRTRMGRSQTQLPPAPTVRPVPGQSRRSHSQDSVVRAANTVEKSKATARKTGNKKGSSHADVIDRLDFSGVGPMFHHDGPFDACAPSRNRHRTKAPMLAWTGPAEEDKDALAAAREIPPAAYPSSYPTPSVYTPYEAPKKKHDAIAEAWGIHEPEPFEDFSAGGGYTQTLGDYGTSTQRNGAASNGVPRRNRDGRDKHREQPEEGHSRRQQTKRSALPPPQPIFVPEAEGEVVDPPSPTAVPSSPGAPKRTKSLMHRIRKMRDSPNVPVGNDDAVISGNEGETSPTSSAENYTATQAQSGARPTHRPQNSFLGRLGRSTNAAPGKDDETYVYVADPPSRKDKSLPATPAKDIPRSPPADSGGYFDEPVGGYASSPGGGIGRRASLLKKVRGVVKGAGPK